MRTVSKDALNVHPSAETLKQLAAQIGIEPFEDSVWDNLAKYCSLAWDWNTKINLTRHTTPELFVQRDLLDSYQLSKLLQANEEVLDLGTGGGVPGILLAILRPDLDISLCDSVAKKAKVAEDIVEKLKLNVRVYPVSVKTVLADERYDSIVARGVGPLVKLCSWLKDEWHKIGRLLAIKGPRWIEERGEARHRGLLASVQLRRLVSYPMPGTESEVSSCRSQEHPARLLSPSRMLQTKRPRDGSCAASFVP
jgi:16S rRNA (guanine527-N7)-methyltransferase